MEESFKRVLLAQLEAKLLPNHVYNTLFSSRFYNMFVHGRPFQPSPMFASKARNYLREALFLSSL
jgi:hypothetical protein